MAIWNQIFANKSTCSNLWLSLVTRLTICPVVVWAKAEKLKRRACRENQS